MSYTAEERAKLHTQLELWRAELRALFQQPVQFCAYSPKEIIWTIGEKGVEAKFTFAQMHALPGILGTDQLDFSTESGGLYGSSWTGEYGGWSQLLIRATYP
jgi:hypothetical protein